MTAVSEDVTADLNQRIAELERRLEAVLIERDTAIERQTASALVNFRLQNEVRAAAERQKASAEILRSIAASAGDAGNALQKIAETTQHFFNAASVTIRIAEGDEWVQTVRVGSGGHLTGAQPNSNLTSHGANLPATVYRDNRQIHIPDLDHIDPSMAAWPATAARAAGIRTICGTPLRRDGRAIGTMIVYRDRLAPFTEEELALQQSFADQAMIAIENARLFNETQEALARQTATSEILRVISGSPTDVQPVFDAIVQTAVRLLDCETAFFQRCEGTHFWTVTRCTKEGLAPVVRPRPTQIDPSANFPSRAITAKQTLYLPDWSVIELPEFERSIRQQLGYNSAIYLPLLRESECIGVLGIAGSRPRMFSEADIALAESFRDQAVIAIENTRLFSETQEALAHQTATSQVLETIGSSMADAQPVFERILDITQMLFNTKQQAILLAPGDGFVHSAAFHGVNAEAFKALYPMPIESTMTTAAMRERRQFYFADALNGTDSTPGMVRAAQAIGNFSIVVTPMVWQDRAIGVLNVSREPNDRFTDKELALLRTLADQAVIAIENARLFNETREALERQTATADILKVIASSPSDVQPVFDAIATSANRLLGGYSGSVFRFADGMASLEAFTPTTPEADEILRSSFPIPETEFAPFEMSREGKPVPIPDTEQLAHPRIREISRARGFRSLLLVPLMSGTTPIGVISVSRTETGTFADHHVQLLQTFADQAVIAIQNTRLFNETQEALARQTATSDILRVISSSPTNVQPVFDAIVQTAVRLIGCDTSFILGCDGAHFWSMARCGKQGLFQITDPRRAPVDPSANFPSRAIVEKQTLHLPDWSEIELPEFERDIKEKLGYNSAAYLPLLREGECIGVLGIAGPRPRMFGEADIALAESFRDQALIAIENARLFNETQEALERQTATAEILKVIASSPSDVQPVFDAIAASANRLIGGFSTGVFRVIDDFAHLAAFTPMNPEADEALKATFPRHRSHLAAVGLIEDGQTAQIADSEMADEQTRQLGRARGWRSITLTPLMSQGTFIGYIVCTRRETGVLADHHVQLLRTFADQAVIAIENTRLFNETKEALERQTATSDILRVIAESPSDVQPVFEAILARSLHLCEAAFGFLTTHDGERFDFAAQLGVPPELAEHFDKGMDQPRPGDAHWRLAEGEDLVHNADQKDEDAYRAGNPLRRAVVDIGGARSALVVALRKSGSLRGSITIYRKEVRPFSESQIALLRHFADQAVIAIENTRLFNEVQARTLELSEALEQQTATSEVLSVISSSAGDLAPVFDAMLGKAMELCGANFGVLNTYDGKTFQTAATYGLPPAYEEYRRTQSLEYGPGTGVYRLLQGEPFVELDDLHGSEPYLRGDPNRRALVDLGGARCLLTVPLLKDERVTGAVMIFRQEDRRFSEKQIALLQQFAAQAVIAIENTRLLRELRESTEDLSESLQQQTATSEVLQAISSSPGDLAPVFEKMLENATRVCGAEFGSMSLVEGDALRQAALYNTPPALAEVRANKALRNHPQSAIAIAISSRQVVHVDDLRNHIAYREGALPTVELVNLGGARTIVVVPMLREGEAIGVITVYRQEVRPFSEKQIELLTNFARQAVIAIENARLLKELRQRTDDLSEALVYQTGSSNILKVIASSPTDVGPALKAIVDSACEICDANDAAVLLKDGDNLALSAHHGPVPFGWEKLPINRRWISGRVVIDRAALHVHDVPGPDGDDFPEGRELMRRDGVRTILSVPLLREDEAIGTIVLRRIEAQPFNDKQIELLKSFADQAVIAISNVRLFEEVQAKTRDLTESLQFQTASSDVLKVISRSPDALQPVLDVIVKTSHELCGSDASTIFLLKDNKFHFTAVSGVVPTHIESLRAAPLEIGHPGSVFTRVAQQKRTLHYPNIADDPELMAGSTGIGGPRALLLVPLIQEDQFIGTIVLRQAAGIAFTPRQIQAVETFADQAVIAISNVNLFDEVQQRTRELSKSLDDLRTAQDRLIQTEKLASLGQLTAGIAHEIKNPLNFVNNFAALSAELTDELKDSLKPAVLDETIRAEVDEITGMLKDNLGKVVQHGKRADSIVKNMLLHSREGSGEHRPVDVNALVEESLNLAYHGARAEKPQFNVTLKQDFDSKAGMIDAFPQEITRVLLNLISNGFYAVTKRKAADGADFEPLVTATTRGSDDNVEIRIRDNGTGIPPEVKEKMFNPFFTTKPAGEGTGLGLSMSHDIIVKQHGGTIDVETEPGAFTEFRLVLPRTSLARTNGPR